MDKFNELKALVASLEEDAAKFYDKENRYVIFNYAVDDMTLMYVNLK